MLLAIIPMSVFALGDTVSNTVSITDYAASANKATDHPFSSWIITISDVDELKTFNTWTGPNNAQDKNGLKGAHIRIENDIDYSGKTWNMMVFDGTFDGNGHTISNVTVAASTSIGGMFKYAGGTIENLTVSGLTSVHGTSANHVGGLVGTRANSNVNSSNLTIANVHIINGNVQGKSSVGGIIGNTNGDTVTDKTVTISNCSFNGTVKGTENVGGIIGYCVNASSVSVSNCSVSLEDAIGTSTYVGSIIGLVNANTTVTNCTVLPSDYNPSNYANLKSGSTKTLETSGCTSGESADIRYYGFQNSETYENTESNTVVDYRIVGTLDAEDLSTLSDVGFYVTLTYSGATKVQKVSCKTVYSSVKGGGITYYAGEGTNTATEEYVDGDYLFVLVIPGVPADVSVDAKFTPYMTDAKGITACGSTQDVTLKN